MPGLRTPVGSGTSGPKSQHWVKEEDKAWEGNGMGRGWGARRGRNILRADFYALLSTLFHLPKNLQGGDLHSHIHLMVQNGCSSPVAITSNFQWQEEEREGELHCPEITHTSFC